MRVNIFQDLINQAILKIDPPGICAGQITHGFLIWGRIFEGIFLKEFQQSFGVRSQPGANSARAEGLNQDERFAILWHRWRWISWQL